MSDLSKLVRDLDHPTVLELRLAEENERLRQELATARTLLASCRRAMEISNGNIETGIPTDWHHMIAGIDRALAQKEE